MNSSLLAFYRHDGAAFFKKHQATTFKYETVEQLFKSLGDTRLAVNHPTGTFCFVTLYETLSGPEFHLKTKCHHQLEL